MFGLVDCNSFYCSCERVFAPATRGIPVVVLSNNDGCAIAFSREAKAIGINQMCSPFYQIKDLIKKHNVAVFSSNYCLYDDMSKRVMSTLTQFTPDLEVYSVDEAFLNLSGFEHYDLNQYGAQIRDTVIRDTGIPVGVGIAPTKVLAKLANKISKKSKGLCCLITEEEIDRALKGFPLKDVWGIGPASVLKLNSIGITTPYEFKAYKNEAHIQKLLTKVGRELQDELRGISCLRMEEVEDKKVIANTRSFGKDTYDKAAIKEALANFATKVGEKLREQNSVCSSLSVFVHTNSFKDLEQYYGSGSHTFQTGTSDTAKLIKAAHKILDDIYRPGFAYKKGGVILTQIVPNNERQIDFFNSDPSDNEALSKVLDAINRRYGPHTLKSAACGFDHAWKLVANYKSKRFTTQWSELLGVRPPG